MSATEAWGGLEPLPPGKTILLEASAGTGKTWQIEGLVVRLVAEYEVAIDKILVITFTNAATAELRDRIRQRLVEARDALAQVDEPTNDPIVTWLWADAAKRDRRRGLLAMALASYDLAPVSTIHGFSQRMLDQLAFESGQEPGLELMTDSKAIVQQLVDDELARVYAEASEQELLVLADMGWTRSGLAQVAQAMTQAVAPLVEPVWPALEVGSVRPLDPVRAWRGMRTTLREWLESAEGQRAVAALRAELARKKGKRLKGMRQDVVGTRLDAVTRWLDGPALRADRAGARPLGTSIKNLGVENWRATWQAGPAELEAFEGFQLSKRISELVAKQDALWPQALASFASRIRAQVEAELLRSGKLTYSTMLSRLAERIASEANNEGQEGPLVSAIRARFEVALVDEFQDTDGAQWPVMQAVFAHPSRRLLIIGDPKQAIYAFRGADVHVYLDAARVAHKRATMRVNWRSDAAYIQAMNHLWAEGSGVFGLADVDYLEVSAAPKHEAPRIRGLPTQDGKVRGAFELRWIDGETVAAKGRVIASKEVGENAAAGLAALEIARLLEGQTEIMAASEQGGAPTWRKLQPGDIAVLVRTNRQAERVRSQLERLKVPSVSAGRGSVMESPVLGWLCAWLDAVADPARDRAARSLATTPLFGWTAHDLATALSAMDAAMDAAVDAQLKSEDAAAARRWQQWLESLHHWAGNWGRWGFVRVFEGALDEFDVLGRLLGARQGERYATDLRHLIELCHAEQQRTRVGPSGLASWLRALRDGGGDGSDDAQALRLESDARAVQLVTIHKSKGLQYPVVLLPFGWADSQGGDSGGPLVGHATVGAHTEIRLNLELQGTAGRKRAAQEAALEVQQEQMRLLYVALTRARHHCVAWLGPLGTQAVDTGSYALGHVALRKRDAAGKPVAGSACPRFTKAAGKTSEKKEAAAVASEAIFEEVRARFERLAATSGQSLSWRREPLLEAREPLHIELAKGGVLQARAWPPERHLISPWQVTSYSAMLAGRHRDESEPHRLDELRAAGSKMGQVVQVERGDPLLTTPGVVAPTLQAPIVSAELRGGKDVGTWTHAVLEDLDFQEGKALDGRELAALVAQLGVRHGVRGVHDHQLLVDALPGILDTPLDNRGSGLPVEFALRSLECADRLDELAFDLRLGSGSHWHAGDGLLNRQGARLALQSRMGDAAPIDVDWLAEVAEGAAGSANGVLPEIAGILSGYIDLVFRVDRPTEDGVLEPRYYISDYKTNRIAPPDQRQVSKQIHYTRPWMAWEMSRHGYHLQALLYTVALHRMLRQRLPGYRYDRHVGGHVYLFLRGMEGAQTPQHEGSRLGVFSDRWPACSVLGLDAALAGRATGEVAAIIDEAKRRGGPS